MFRVKKLFAAFAGTMILTMSIAEAETGAWRVIEMHGAVRTSQPISGVQQISTGAAVNAGAVVSTGVNGRLVLARGEQQIVIGPSSRMSLPAMEEPGMTRILQDLGTLLFKVDKRNTQHFLVETPVIAAVVKGTTFTVTAGAAAHAVHVAEGAVEVSAISGSARQLVTPGMTVYVSRNEPNVIRTGAASGDRFDGSNDRGNEGRDLPAGDGKASDEKHALSVPSEIGGAALDYADLTGGLIDGDARNAQSAAQASFGQSRAAASSPGANVAAAVRQVAISNASANSNGNVGNGNGNTGNGNGNGNAGNGNGNGNAGNGNGNGNAGNGNGNGNAGNGNGNGNAGNGNGNGNAGNGNGNGNAGNGNGNGNAGNGNGNGNAGNGNGNGNAGNGNGNGNAGNGNGNGNAGNGNGNGNAGNGNADQL